MAREGKMGRPTATFHTDVHHEKPEMDEGFCLPPIFEMQACAAAVHQVRAPRTA